LLEKLSVPPRKWGFFAIAAFKVLTASAQPEFRAEGSASFPIAEAIALSPTL
jgi:hypothetical protein